MSEQLQTGELVRVQFLEHIYRVVKVYEDHHTVRVLDVDLEEGAITVPIRHVERISAVERLGDLAP